MCDGDMYTDWSDVAKLHRTKLYATKHSVWTRIQNLCVWNVCIRTIKVIVYQRRPEYLEIGREIYSKFHKK